MNVRVLIADDHSVFRNLLREVLESEEDIVVVAEVGDGHELIKAAPNAKPDVVCLDVSMPGLTGLDATQQLVAAQPQMKVIAISGHADESYINGMLKAGARAYLLKDEVGEHLIAAVRAVQRNETYLCPQSRNAVSAATGAARERIAPAVRLESRERQILQLIAAGKSPADIAERLQMPPATVSVHCRNIMRKLDLHGEAELREYAAAYAGGATDAPGASG